MNGKIVRLWLNWEFILRIDNWNAVPSCPFVCRLSQIAGKFETKHKSVSTDCIVWRNSTKIQIQWPLNNTMALWHLTLFLASLIEHRKFHGYDEGFPTIFRGGVTKDLSKCMAIFILPPTHTHTFQTRSTLDNASLDKGPAMYLLGKLCPGPAS